MGNVPAYRHRPPTGSCSFNLSLVFLPVVGLQLLKDANSGFPNANPALGIVILRCLGMVKDVGVLCVLPTPGRRGLQLRDGI